MTQKILKVGSSAAVTIPKNSLEELGIKVGDSVSVEVDKKNQTFIVKPASAQNLETRAWTKKFIERYRPALDALAKQ